MECVIIKKIAGLLLFVILLLTFSSCFLIKNDLNDVRTILAYPVCISAVIEQESKIEFKIYVYENETLFNFNSPETLSLLSVKKNSDGYFAQYSGLETKIDRSSVMAVDLLDSALKTIHLSEDCSQHTEDDQNVLLFSIDGNTVLVYYDNETGTIGKIISESGGQSFTYRILSVTQIQV